MKVNDLNTNILVAYICNRRPPAALNDNIVLTPLFVISVARPIRKEWKRILNGNSERKNSFEGGNTIDILWRQSH